MKKHLELLLPDHQLPAEVEVNGLTRDSRQVQPGNLFVAVPGVSGDGRQHIQEAINRQAGAVLYEDGWGQLPASDSVPVFGIKDLGSKVGEMASRFFEHPSMDMRIVAVTGTNGKTSCSHFVASALNSLGIRCGVVGTLGSGFPEALRNPGLTTPESIELQQILAELKKKGAKVVAMEASSHGLDQGRLDGVNVDIAVLTNISRDHLDYHSDYEQYKKAKSRLFLRTGLSGMVLNIDDELGRELHGKMRDMPGLLTYSKEDPGADLLAEDLELNDRGISFTLRIAGARTHIQSPLIGAFNISNLLALAGVLYLMRFGSDDISRRLSSVRGVRGRMDVLKNQNFPTIVVDYAHTPDALDKALQAIRAHCQGKLWCVFGCGGDRDKGKRPEMGAIASRLADRIVVTDDNPRYEESEAIIEDILAGKELSCESEIVPDRSAAISKAIKNAGPSDWVLIAGKGHEDYQEIRGQRFPYSDYDVVKELIGGNTGKH